MTIVSVAVHMYFRQILLLTLIGLTNGSGLSELAKTMLGEQPRKYQQRESLNSYYQFLPLRPSSPLMIPLDIQENPNKDLDPDLDVLDEYKLISVLGTDYNPYFMSLRQPYETKVYPNGRLYYHTDNRHIATQAQMPQLVSSMDNKEIKLYEDTPPLRVKFSRKNRQKIQRFLWAYTYCPVRYTWKQLSVRFWPRWIRTGSCDTSRSCSIPTGMTCQPSKMTNIKILRYYCPLVGLKRNCQWIKFDYPILETCSCACQRT